MMMKMKSKIYHNICLMAVITMVLVTMVTAFLFCVDLQKQMKQEVKAELRYLSAAMETDPQGFLSRLSGHGDGNAVNRITWISADGEVLYDSYSDEESMENHAQRPEVQQALSTGRGDSTRLSDTLSEQTYYSALRLSDGTVIRVASTTRSGFAVLVQMIPWMAIMTLVIFAGTFSFARVQTRQIVRPINEMDLDHPDPEKVYDELSPLIRRIEKQNETIVSQMAEIWQKQEEFTAITENMEEGFIIVDSHAEVLSFNSSAIRILGVNMMNRDGRPANVLDLNRSNAFRQVVDQALDGHHSEQKLELNGSFYQIIANPVNVSADKGNGAVVIILDVTEREYREEMRREFTANVSHELKTPLTSISGYAEIMQNGMVQPEDMARFSGKIYSEAQRLISLVNDIIRLSQLDEGKQDLEKSKVDLYMAASRTLDYLKETAKKAEISLCLKGKPVVIEGVSAILDEMIYNLCDNAIKYNHPDGYVIVTVHKENGHPTLKVEDNGIGIPDADQPRVFERFYRVDKSHSRQIGGTGLGLSIVKHAAIYHNARIELTSKVGKGTTIKITFPAL